MTTEVHDGVVVFEPQAGGRERVMLGQVPVGEIGPVPDPRSLYPTCWHLSLPWAMSKGRWQPANDVADARRQILARINDWLNLADLRPNGSAHAK